MVPAARSPFTGGEPIHKPGKTFARHLLEVHQRHLHSFDTSIVHWMKLTIVAWMVLSSALAQAREMAIFVPSDSRAVYTVVERSKAGSKRTILTKRVGPSGTTYARREVDCVGETFRYLGEGDSVAEARRGKATDQMGPLVHGSISYYVAREACK